MAKRYADKKNQAEDLVLPLTAICAGGKNSFYRWLDDLCEAIDDKEERASLKNRLLSVQERVIENVEGYKFPVVLLSDKTPADAVCTIFETLNRTGVKLSVFDLLAARFWPEQVKLREMWESAVEAHPILPDFEIDPYYVLQTIALLRTEGAPSCKRKEVLQLKSGQVARGGARRLQGWPMHLRSSVMIAVCSPQNGSRTPR